MDPKPVTYWLHRPRILSLFFFGFGLFILSLLFTDPDPSYFLCLFFGLLFAFMGYLNLASSYRIHLNPTARTYILYQYPFPFSRSTTGPWSDFDYILLSLSTERGSSYKSVKFVTYLYVSLVCKDPKSSFFVFRKKALHFSGKRTRKSARVLAQKIATYLELPVQDYLDVPSKLEGVQPIRDLFR